MASDTTYYYVSGMEMPYWALTGDRAVNLDSDTDMGDLTSTEFTEWFLPRAKRISQSVAHARGYGDGDGR